LSCNFTSSIIVYFYVSAPRQRRPKKMPYLETAQQWLTQSTLLLQARPTTTRITTKYTIKPPPTALLTPTESKPLPKPTESSKPEPPRATLTLKTYDPASGTTLKYSTTKQAEVSRLIQILGRLARPMAGLAEVKEELVDGETVGTPVTEIVSVVAQGKGAQGAGGQGQGAGGKKKKKGKK